MKSFILALAVVTAIPLASQAQIVIQTPNIPGITTPRREPERDDYWRHQRENEREAEWRRRDEYQHEDARREDWQRAHCVRDWQGQEFCRR